MLDSSGNARHGAYGTSPSPIPKTAIYTGGGTCMLGTSVTSAGIYTGTPPTLNDMTLLTIVNFNALTGYRPLICRDDNSSGRKWQWRSNGTSMEFVKIVGGVSTTTQASVFIVGQTALVAVTISAAGALNFYKNSATPIKTASIAAANYGGVGDSFGIGYSTGTGGGANAYFSESAIFGTVLSGADIAAIAAAAGL